MDDLKIALLHSYSIGGNLGAVFFLHHYADDLCLISLSVFLWNKSSV